MSGIFFASKKWQQFLLPGPTFRVHNGKFCNDWCSEYFVQFQLLSARRSAWLVAASPLLFVEQMNNSFNHFITNTRLWMPPVPLACFCCCFSPGDSHSGVCFLLLPLWVLQLPEHKYLMWLERQKLIPLVHSESLLCLRDLAGTCSVQQVFMDPNHTLQMAQASHCAASWGRTWL